jgi:two-component system sensor histidine kinase YesM
MEQEQKRLYELDALQGADQPALFVQYAGFHRVDAGAWTESGTRSLHGHGAGQAFRISISKGRNNHHRRRGARARAQLLIIQSIRFKNKFTHTIAVQPEALNLGTVKLILQPLVENAIVHGLAHFVTDEGHIEITASVEENLLVFRVRDNGLGMSPKQVCAVLTREGAGGIGLRNVHERIALTYGEGYGLSIESEEDVGTLVTVRQPAAREEGSP